MIPTGNCYISRCHSHNSTTSQPCVGQVFL